MYNQFLDVSRDMRVSLEHRQGDLALIYTLQFDGVVYGRNDLCIEFDRLEEKSLDIRYVKFPLAQTAS